MGRSLNELVTHLKETIENLQSDAHNIAGFNKHRYNNLKIIIPEYASGPKEFKIRIGISEAAYDLNTMEKKSGSLGQDEKYIQRWLKNSTVIMDLKALFDNLETKSGEKAK